MNTKEWDRDTAKGILSQLELHLRNVRTEVNEIGRCVDILRKETGK